MTADRILQRASMAARLTAAASPVRKAAALRLASTRIREQSVELETAAKLDGRRFTEADAVRLADGIQRLAEAPEPVGRILSGGKLADGRVRSTLRVPLGTVGILAGGDPATVIRLAALLLAGGNAALFGAEATADRAAALAVELFRRALLEAGLPADAVSALPAADTRQLLTSPVSRMLVVCDGAALTAEAMRGCVPPCLLLTRPITHLYAAPDADPTEIAELAVSACTTVAPLHTLLLHDEAASAVLPPLTERARTAGLTLCGDDTLCRDFGLAPADHPRTPAPGRLCVRLVGSRNEALARIQLYGSGHLAGIITRDCITAQRFAVAVDTAVVTVNTVPVWPEEDVLCAGIASGAARGPVTADTFMTEKQILFGNGQLY